MTILGDAFDSVFKGPLERTFQGFKQVFTNPGKANLGDFASVALPFWGGTIAYDVNHPTAVGYQAGAVALAMGGVAAAGGSPLAGGVSPSLVPESPLLSSVPAAPASDPIAFALTGTPAASAPEYGAPFLGGGSPAAINVAAPAGSSWGSAIAAAAAKTGAFIKEAATVSAAAKSLLTPWESAIQKGAQLVNGGGAPARGATVIGSGGGPAGPNGAKPAASSLSAPVLIAGAAVVGLGVWAFLKWRRK